MALAPIQRVPKGPSSTAHPELADMVNDVKRTYGVAPNGPFYINEYKHVIVPVRVCELAGDAALFCDLAEHGRRECEGCAGAHAARTRGNDAGHLPAVRAGVAAAGRRSAEQFGRNGAVNQDRIKT